MAGDVVVHFDDDQYPRISDSDEKPRDSHVVSRADSAILIGISSLEGVRPNYVSGATENDVHTMRDIFIDVFGLKPSAVHALSTLSQSQAKLETIKKTLSKVCKGARRGSALFLYLSAPCWEQDGHHFIPTQEYRRRGAHSFGITSDLLEKYLSRSDASRVFMFLDCDNAGEFARPLLAALPDKQVCVVAAQGSVGRSHTDERILKHGYLTFFLKFYLKRLRVSSLSVGDLLSFLQTYTTPLSRFQYHPKQKQMVQEPVVLISGEDEVEVDGLRATAPAPSWRDVITSQCSAYTDWLEERREDCVAVLGEGTFARTQLYIHLYLTCLRSFSLILLERDKLYLAKMDKDDIERLADAIVSIISGWVSDLAHPDHDRWDAYDGLGQMDRDFVLTGLRQGAGLAAEESEKTAE